MVDFDWNWPAKIVRGLVESIVRADFVDAERNVVPVAQGGLGKTVIAHDIASAAILAGHTVLFLSAAQLLLDLASQASASALERRLRYYARVRLLILDEVGFLGFDNRNADLLFQVVSRRYEKKSIVVTTNPAFKEWNTIFPSAVCATALVERVIHHADVSALLPEARSWSHGRAATFCALPRARQHIIAMMAAELHDPDLTPLLRGCSTEELQPLVEYVTKTKTNTYGSATKQGIYTSPHIRLVDDLVHEIRTFGGNSLVNVVRGGGVAYAEVVRDVASQLKAKAAKDASVEDLELAILLKILDESIKKMSPEERGAVEDDFRRAGVKNVSLGAGVPIATVIAQAGVQLTGFFAYRTAAIVANAIAKLILGRGLSLGANAALMRILGTFAGPVGWAVSGIWTVVDLAGPAYRVTIPCVCHVAFLRQKRKFGDLAEA